MRDSDAGPHRAPLGEGPDGCAAAFRPLSTTSTPPAPEPVRPSFDWQAILMRYLPDAHGAAHSAKRLSGLR